jgi:hypothetical protein
MSWNRRSFGPLALAALGGYALHAAAEGGPVDRPLFYAGSVSADGKPLEGTHSVSVKLYASETAGTPLCATPSLAVEFRSGHFRTDLASAEQSCREAVQGNADTWVELQVDTTLLPRSKVGAVPYALESTHALTATSLSGPQAAELTQLKGAVSALQQGMPGMPVATPSYRFLRQGSGCTYDQPANATVCSCELGEVILPAGGWAGPDGALNASRHQAGPDNPTASDAERARHWILSCDRADGTPVECQLVQALCLKL